MEINVKFTKFCKKSYSDLKTEGFKIVGGRGTRWRKYVSETDESDTFYEYQNGTIRLVQVTY